MILADSAFARPRFFSSLQEILSDFRDRHRSESAIAHLDDRLRADVGLPPTHARALLPHEAATRIAMMAWR